MRMRLKKRKQQSNSQVTIQPQLQQRPFDTPGQTEQAVNLPATHQQSQKPEWSFGNISVFPPKRSLNPIAIQPKLTIGQPNDKYEQEADLVAAQVVQRINAPASAQPTIDESIQRQSESEEEELQAKLDSSIIQRQEAISGEEASTDLASSINSAKGGGQPLDASLQKSMSQAMGADFSGVRVHTNTQSDELNQSIQAKAFTTGQDVFFRQGAYQPDNRRGQELIAHELTHVVQQNREIGNRIQKEPFNEQNIEKDKILTTVRSISGKDDLVLNLRVLSKRELAAEYFPSSNYGFTEYNDAEHYDMVKDMVPAAFCRVDDGYVFVNKEEFGNDKDGYDYKAINAVLIHESQHAASHEFKGFQKGHGVDLSDDPEDRTNQFLLDEGVTDLFAMISYAEYRDVLEGEDDQGLQGAIDDYLTYTNYYFGGHNGPPEKWLGSAILEMINKGLFSLIELRAAYMEGDRRIINDNKDQINKILRKYNDVGHNHHH